MASRTYDQIYKALNPSYDPSRQLVQEKLDLLPGQSAAQRDALDAKLSQANDNIMVGARRRGLGFAGIPLGEQAEYAATEYAPALAELENNQLNQSMSLREALLGLTREQRERAQGIFDSERAFAEQQRQFNEQLKAQREAEARQSALMGGYSFGGGGEAAPAAKATGPTMTRRADGGFDFKDKSGKIISAAQYTKLMQPYTGISFTGLLKQMAKAGDMGAKTALQYVGDDFGYNPTKVGTNQKAINLLNSLLWGVTSVKPYSNSKPQSPFTFFTAPARFY